MKKISLLVLVFVALLIGACTNPEISKYEDQFWVTTSKADVYSKPTVLSKIIQTYKFNDTVFGLDKKPKYSTPKEWLEIKLGPGNYGFVERNKLGNKAFVDQLNAMKAATEGLVVQAKGLIGKKASIKTEPSRVSRTIETLKEPQIAQIYGRMIKARDEKTPDKKDIWYKIQLEDGRVGYITSSNITLTPPNEINVYTQIRNPVSWHELRTVENKETGTSGKDYIVAYASIGLDMDTDFSRIELYSYDAKSGKYSTSLARSGLAGVLPIEIIDNGDGRKSIKIRQKAKGKEGKLFVQEYSFPSPIKIVKEYEEDANTTSAN